jgi:heat shock protein HslJ
LIRLAILVILLFVSIVLAACSSLTEPEADAGNLVGPAWILTELSGEKPLPGTTIFLEFSEDGAVNGSDGCNNMGRTYTVDGDSISFSAMGPTTLMACPEPVMAQATAFQQALDDAESYSISGDTLTLLDAGGDAVATFQAQDQSLEGSSWTVLSYNNGKGGVTTVILDTEITADFGEDGIVTGTDGCNNYSRPYETDGNNITIGEQGATTAMACPDEIMEQAAAYQQALTNTATYEIIGNSMDFYSSEGSRMAVFNR